MKKVCMLDQQNIYNSNKEKISTQKSENRQRNKESDTCSGIRIQTT